MGRADDAQLELLVKLATRYHIHGESQATIALAEHLSRPTVSRLLAQARELGVVTVTVQHPLRRVRDLEGRLVEAFRLDHAWVADVRADHATDAGVLEAVARHAAHVVDDLVGPDSVVSLSNGSTLHAVAAELQALRPRRRRDSTVVQMIGALGPRNVLIDGPELCRRLAGSFGGSYRVMPVPLVVGSERIATAMRREASIATTLALASHPDVALVGIGSTTPPVSGRIFDGWLSADEVAELAEAGAVGHIAGHHFDRDGRHLTTAICRRTVGVPLPRLREMPQVVGVAAGSVKADAVLGALRGGFLDTLVVDVALAEAVLAADGGRAQTREHGQR